MSSERRLNAIIGFSEVMHNGTFGDLGSPRYTEYSSFINQSGRYLLGIISDILDMSTLETGDFELNKTLVNVRECIETVIAEEAVDASAKSIDLIHDDFPDVYIRADHDAIGKVLKKIVRNAVKFTHEGGKVTVRLFKKDYEADIVIEDTGVGISPENLELIIRPFEQVNSPIRNGMKGSGLGLAIAQSFIRLHGGLLKIESAVGNGTRVMVRLPLSAASAAAEKLAQQRCGSTRAAMN